MKCDDLMTARGFHFWSELSCSGHRLERMEAIFFLRRSILASAALGTFCWPKSWSRKPIFFQGASVANFFKENRSMEQSAADFLQPAAHNLLQPISASRIDPKICCQDPWSFRFLLSSSESKMQAEPKCSSPSCCPNSPSAVASTLTDFRSCSEIPQTKLRSTSAVAAMKMLKPEFLELLEC